MKKKKKSIHLRRVRERSDNKFAKISIKHFYLFLKIFFLRKLKKKFSFCSFLLSFYGINISKVFFLFKKFGLNKYYLFEKYKSLDLFLSVFKKKYYIYIYNKSKKRINVNNKKNLFIHVSYRHFLNLPVRGQRTKTNAKTRKHYAII